MLRSLEKRCLVSQPMDDVFLKKKKWNIMFVGPNVQKKNKEEVYRMHNSESILYLSCAFDSPCFLRMGLICYN